MWFRVVDNVPSFRDIFIYIYVSLCMIYYMSYLCNYVLRNWTRQLPIITQANSSYNFMHLKPLLLGSNAKVNTWSYADDVNSIIKEIAPQWRRQFSIFILLMKYSVDFAIQRKATYKESKCKSWKYVFGFNFMICVSWNCISLF